MLPSYEISLKSQSCEQIVNETTLAPTRVPAEIDEVPCGRPKSLHNLLGIVMVDAEELKVILPVNALYEIVDGVIRLFTSVTNFEQL